MDDRAIKSAADRAEAASAKASEKQGPHRFQPGQSGNPAGKAKGTRHKATEMIEALMEGNASAVAQAVIRRAEEGDIAAAKLVLDRLCPPRKGRPITLNLPEINGLQDLATAQSVVVRAVADGEISPDEASDISRVLEGTGASIERRTLESRIAALEEKHAKS